jgi:hypothetical protein
MTHEELIAKYEKGERNFRGADLEGADLMGANLRYANLWGADLRDAVLRDANLMDADLRKADLRGADLEGANLLDANLWGADLRDAYLRGAYLKGADLMDANLQCANLQRANLEGANLSQSIGIQYADVVWHAHGERGRRLLAVKIDSELVFFCGCFRGDEGDLRDYIEKGPEEYKASRLKALEFLLSCFEDEECNK